MPTKPKTKRVKAWVSKVRNQVMEVSFNEPYQKVQEIMKFNEGGKIVIRWYPCVITYTLPATKKK